MNPQILTLDCEAQALAKDLLSFEAKLLTKLMEMKRLNAFAVLNYSGIFDYCERRLRFSRAQSYYYKSVAEKSEEVPALVEAINQGQLSLSEARRIAPIVTEENTPEWVAKAKELSQAKLEEAVAEINPKSRPRDKIKPIAKDTFEIKTSGNHQTKEDLTVIQDMLSQKRQKHASLRDAIAWAASVARDKIDPERKAQRALKKSVSSGNSFRHCEERRDEATPAQRTARGLLRPLASQGRGVGVRRKPIRQSVKHEIIRNDGMQCVWRDANVVRCQQRRWLDFHHIKEVRNGGLNIAPNLKLLCYQHHRQTHEAKTKEQVCRGPNLVNTAVPLPRQREVQPR